MPDCHPSQFQKITQAKLAALTQAYEQAIYEVYENETTIQFFIGQYCPPVDCLLVQSNCYTWALITAANPHSHQLSEQENQQRHQRLMQDLARSQFWLLPGMGKDPQGIWTPEQSLLVIGIERSEAIAIGQKFEQNAIVFGEFNQPVKLQWLVTTNRD